MKTHDFLQNSPEWHAHRAVCHNASDAPAMMGVSPYKTRAELLRERRSGFAAEVDARTQQRFDDGHRYEALARPLAERIIGEDLYAVTGSEGRLSASFDGLTMGEDIAYEHKSINDDLRSVMVGNFTGVDLPPLYRVQMEQQLMVSGATRVLFMASKWNTDGTLVEERHCWYESDPALRSAILAGWAQFERDLAEYVPHEIVDTPKGKRRETLPALRIEISGAVSASNLDQFKQTALAAIRSVNRELKTDAHFADAAEDVKWCEEVESRLAAAKEYALSQTASIDALFKAVDDISAEARTVRLELDKLVTKRKAELRESIVMGARTAFDEHVAALKAETTGLWNYVPAALPDFNAAAKNKRTIATLQDAVDTALANAKIAADAIAKDIRGKLAWLTETAADYGFLFADKGSLVTKPLEDFKLTVTTRIDAHKAAEAKKEADRIEADRLARLQEVTDAAKKMAEAVSAAAAEREPVIIPPHGNYSRASASVASPSVAAQATLNVGAINRRFGPGFVMTSEFILSTLKVPASTVVKGNSLWSEAGFQAICRKHAEHAKFVAEVHEEATA